MPKLKWVSQNYGVDPVLQKSVAYLACCLLLTTQLKKVIIPLTWASNTGTNQWQKKTFSFLFFLWFSEKTQIYLKHTISILFLLLLLYFMWPDWFDFKSCPSECSPLVSPLLAINPETPIISSTLQMAALRRCCCCVGEGLEKQTLTPHMVHSQTLPLSFVFKLT